MYYARDRWERMENSMMPPGYEVYDELERLLENEGNRCSLRRFKSIAKRNPRALRFSNPRNGSTLIHVACGGNNHRKLGGGSIFKPNRKSDDEQENEAIAPLKIIRFLVKRFPDALGMRNGAYETPFDVACKSGASLPVIRYLDRLDPWALKLRSLTGYSSLHLAVESGARLQVVRYLLKKCPSALSGTDGFKNTPLHVLSQLSAPDPDTVRLMVESYPEALGLKNSRSQTPLHLLCGRVGRLGRAEVEYYVDKSPSSVLVRDGRDNTPLHLACRNRLVTLDAVEYLIQKSPQAVVTRNKHQETPLHCLCKGGASLEIVKFVASLYPQALGMAAGVRRDTPLHHLCEEGRALAFLQFCVQAFPAACLAVNADHLLPIECLERRRFSMSKSPAKVLFMNDATNAASSALFQAFSCASLEVPRSFVDLCLVPRPHQSPPPHHFSVPGDSCTQSHDDKELLYDVLRDPDFQVQLWRREYQSFINGVYRMNQVGRNYIHDEPSNQVLGVKILGAVNEDINCLFLHLRENPLLMQR